MYPSLFTFDNEITGVRVSEVFLDETSLSSPRKLFIFMNSKVYFKDQSIPKKHVILF